MTKERDNFFPGMFEYHNTRVYDGRGHQPTRVLERNLQVHHQSQVGLSRYGLTKISLRSPLCNAVLFLLVSLRKAGAKCLVHCKMGMSYSASTVIAYAMKEYGWSFDMAFDYVKERRAVTKPNPSFRKQLEEYQGILLARCASCRGILVVFT